MQKLAPVLVRGYLGYRTGAMRVSLATCPKAACEPPTVDLLLFLYLVLDPTLTFLLGGIGVRLRCITAVYFGLIFALFSVFP